MREKKLRSFVGMGAVALAVILIILTITCFAVLTYVSADSEYKLSEKSRNAVSQYYEADAKANERLAEISALIKNKKSQDFIEKKGYNVTTAQGKDIVTFQVSIEKGKVLQVEAAFSTYDRVTILKWEIENLLQEDNQ